MGELHLIVVVVVGGSVTVFAEKATPTAALPAASGGNVGKVPDTVEIVESLDCELDRDEHAELIVI